MYKRFFHLLLTLTLTMILTVACNDTDENGAKGNVEDPPQNLEDNNDVENENNKDNKNDENGNLNNAENENDENENNDGSTPSEEVAATTQLPDPIEINEKIQHPNGVLFILEKITFKEEHILVDFNAQNGHGFKVNLAKEGRAEKGELGGITLQDDTGLNYLYLAKMGSHRIDLYRDEKVSGTLSFMGEIDDNAQSLTLIFNPDGSEDDSKSRVPKFVFEDIKINR